MNSKPWLAHYEAHVPEHIEYPETVLPGVLRARAHDYGYRTAMIFKGGRLTYREFNRGEGVRGAEGGL